MYIRAAYASMDLLWSISLILQSFLKVFEDVERLTCWISSIGAGIFFANIQMTAIIAIERYYYFCEPMKYPRYFTSKSITCFVIGVLVIAESYMISTELLIGRKTPNHFSSWRLENQEKHKLLQLLVFFVPAAACTCFSVFSISRLIDANRRSINPQGDQAAAMKNSVGRKTLRYLDKNVYLLFSKIHLTQLPPAYKIPRNETMLTSNEII